MKRFFSVLISVIIVLQFCSILSFAADESGSPKHIPRIVSIVFDDSGSMYSGTDRWAYTSYAMQAFTAMMGEDDVLHVTYLNNSASSGVIDLSAGNKQNTVNGFKTTLFGGGTPNKMSEGAQWLVSEYAKHGANAKYYLVVMADGELDLGLGQFSEELPKVVKETAPKLAGVDFQTIYFSMKKDDETSISDVNVYKASTSDSIVKELKNVSAEIMGRTDITESCTVSDGKVSFELKYPALNIALVVQKEKASPEDTLSFSNVTFDVTKEGNKESYNIDTYYMECPIEANKRTDYTDEVIPANPPVGFASLISNGDASLGKGTYTIDLSKYDLTKDNIAVMVEPAVKIGCQYYVSDNENSLEFSQIASNLREGVDIRVKCGLYEINADGTLGDAIPTDVLSPDFKMYINDAEIGTKDSSDPTMFKITASKDYENKDLKIEARLEGYQPFVLRETFGELYTKPIVDKDVEGYDSEITLTKPKWYEWMNGEGEIRFPLTQADDGILNSLSIKVSGYDKLAAGEYASIKDYMKIDGNDIVYIPKITSSDGFASVPDEFTVTLFDSFDSKSLADIKVKTVRPLYKLAVEDELQGKSFELTSLKDNAKKVAFTLTVDYDGSGTYVPIEDGGCETDVKLTIDAGKAPGNKSESFGNVSFVPNYDPTADTGTAASDISGKEFVIKASATVDGTAVEEQSVSFAVNKVNYKILVQNDIKEAFTLDTVKSNSQKIHFIIQADYSNGDKFGSLASWDESIYDKLIIEYGDLPGAIESEYDQNGNLIGKSYTPVYDENNNNGVVFTKIAGKTHTIQASIKGYDVTEKTTVEVLAPKYDITVRKGGITLFDYSLYKNNKGVEFVVSRDGRNLTKAELEALAPYNLTFSKEQKHLEIKTSVVDLGDGTAYLSVVPHYEPWRFISPGMWNWISILHVGKGAMNITLTAGTDFATAELTIMMHVFAFTILLIILAVLIIIIWITICAITRMKFTNGEFCILRLKPDEYETGWIPVYGDLTRVRSNSKSVSRFFRGLISIRTFWKDSIAGLFAMQKMSLGLNEYSVQLKNKRNSIFEKHSDPYVYLSASAKKELRSGTLRQVYIDRILDEKGSDSDIGISLNDRPIKGDGFALVDGAYICEDVSNGKVILFFVPTRNNRKKKK